MQDQVSKKKTGKGNRSMVIATIVMGVIAVGLLILGYARGEGEYLTGLRIGGRLTFEVIPLLLFAFIIAGMVQVLIPSELISRWIGVESGLKGILLGCIAGSITPGGPYVCFPIVAGLYRSGAGIGTTIAFVTAWSLWAFARLPVEVGLLGWRFVMIRIVSTLIFPPIAGLIAQALFGRMKI